MRKLSLNEQVYPARDYTFEYSKNFLEFLIRWENLREHLNSNSSGFFFVESVTVTGTIKLNLRFIQSYTVDMYAQWIDKLLDDYATWNTNFVAAYEGSYSVLNSAADTAGAVLKPISGELSKILIPVAVIVVGGLILWKKL